MPYNLCRIISKLKHWYTTKFEIIMIFTRLSLLAKCTRCFVIHARFEDLVRQIPKTKWNEIYHGVPLSNLSSSSRGDILEQWAKHMDPYSTDALPSLCHDGRKRSKRQGEYDFLSRGQIRVEVKSSSLCWNTNTLNFYIRFCNVKPSNDEVRLITYTPHGLYIHKWNGKFKSRNKRSNTKHIKDQRYRTDG